MERGVWRAVKMIELVRVTWMNNGDGGRSVACSENDIASKGGMDEQWRWKEECGEKEEGDEG